MRLYGYNPLSGGGVREFQPPAGRRGSFRFMEELQKASDSASAKKTQDSAELSKDKALKALYDQLTPASKDVVERIKVEDPAIKKDAWNGLCRELQSLGAITEEDFLCTRSDLRLIPIGYSDQNGEFVTYELPPILKDNLLRLHGNSQGKAADGIWMRTADQDWDGDPLNYLDDWAATLCSWRSSLARMRSEDGSLKYDNFSPLTRQIDSCQKVSALVRDLGRL